MFWRLTHAEFSALADGHAERERRAHEAIVTQAWYIAALSRTKRLPELGRLLKPGKARVLKGDELEERRREFAELQSKLGADR